MKKDNPLFTVVIPTYNRAKLLKKAIQSVIDQTISDWELIVVDNGSTDNTKIVVLEFNDKRIQYFFQEENDRSAARNRGVLEAIGEYICFLDDDDYYLKNHLNVFYNFFAGRKNTEVILRSGFSKEFKDGRREKLTNYDVQKHKNPVFFSAYNMCAVVTLCIPRKFLKDDLFPVGFPHWQDTHLILRLLSKYPFHQLDAYTYIYRIHPLMGSIYLFTEKEFSRRMELNLAAIQDLFDNYDLGEFLPKNTSSFLLAEKQLQYAIKAIPVLGRREGVIFLERSLRKKISWRLWRLYAIFGIGFIHPKYLTR